MEASIGALNNDDARRRRRSRATTPFDQLAVTLTHNKARDNDDEVFINQTDSRGRSRRGRSSTR